MAEKRSRNYAAEYSRRNELAKQRGFRNYGQQRRYTEYTGAPAKYVVAPPDLGYIPSPVYRYDDYSAGDDPSLDIFIRMGRYKGMDEAEAYDRYMRRGSGRSLSRGQLKRLEMDVFEIDEDETWY
jgi:hypothetical protein